MKKIIVLLIVALAFTATKAQSYSHRKDSVRNTYHKEVLLNPFSFFVGGFEMGYGVINPANNRITRLFAGYYFTEAADSYGDNFRNMEGGRFELQHLFTKPVDGAMRFYAGGFAVYKTINMEKRIGNTQNYSTVNGSALSFGLIVGARNYVADNFFLDLFIGGGPTIGLNRSNEDDVHLDIVNPYKRSINPRAGFTFGISF